MTRKIIAALILVPLAAVIVALAVANRHAVTLSLDLLPADKPALAVTLPLFVALLLALLAGVIVGGIAAWLRQGRWRRAARRAEAEARRLRAENETLKQRIEMGERATSDALLRPIGRRQPAE
jgi:uncharacterized integral membrane protein